MGRWKDHDLCWLGQCLSRQRINHRDAINGVTEHLDARNRLFIGSVNLYGVAAHPKVATPQCHVVSSVLKIYKTSQNAALVVINSDMQLQ